MNIMRFSFAWALLFACLVACGGNPGKESSEKDQDSAETLAAGNGNDLQDDRDLVPEGEQQAPIELDREGDVDVTADVTLIDPEEALDQIESGDVNLVDVRTPDAFAREHLPDAQNVDFTSIGFMRQIGNLNGSHPLIIYCQDGQLSPDAAALAGSEGFPDVYVIRGGLDQWKQLELPVE